MKNIVYKSYKRPFYFLSIFFFVLLFILAKPLFEPNFQGEKGGMYFFVVLLTLVLVITIVPILVIPRTYLTLNPEGIFFHSIEKIILWDDIKEVSFYRKSIPIKYNFLFRDFCYASFFLKDRRKYFKKDASTLRDIYGDISVPLHLLQKNPDTHIELLGPYLKRVYVSSRYESRVSSPKKEILKTGIVHETRIQNVNRDELAKLIDSFSSKYDLPNFDYKIITTDDMNHSVEFFFDFDFVLYAWLINFLTYPEGLEVKKLRVNGRAIFTDSLLGSLNGQNIEIFVKENDSEFDNVICKNSLGEEYIYSFNKDNIEKI